MLRCGGNWWIRCAERRYGKFSRLEGESDIRHRAGGVGGGGGVVLMMARSRGHNERVRGFKRWICP